MSVKIMSQVFDCNMPELKTDKGETVSDSAGKFVLLALADHASEDGEGCYPGVRRICRKTNLSIGTVVKALNALRHNGFTKLEGQSRRKTFNYTVLVARIREFQWLEQSDSSGQNSSVLVARAKTSLTELPTPKKNDEAALATISKAYSSEIGIITPMIADELREASTAYPLQWTLDAIKEAATQNKRGWKYVLAILTRWKAQGNQEAMTKPQGKPNNYKPRDLIQERYGGIMEWLKEAQENDNSTGSGFDNGESGGRIPQLEAR